MQSKINQIYSWQILHGKSIGDFNLLTIKIKTPPNFKFQWLIDTECEDNKTAWNKGFKTIHIIIKTISNEFLSIDFNLLPPHPYLIRLLYFLGHPNPLRITFSDHRLENMSPGSERNNLYNNVLLHALIKFNCLFSLPK